MDVFNIELNVTATEGAIHNLQTLSCLAWVLATNDDSIPLFQDPGHAAVLTRPDGGYGPLVAREPRIPNAPLAEVVALMRHLGLPGRTPRVQARPGNMTGSQNIVLDIRLGAARGLLPLQMNYAGLEGEDAEPCIRLLTRLFELLGVPYLGNWVDPQYVPKVAEESVPEASPPPQPTVESEKTMAFDTERVRPALEAISPDVPDGMVNAVIALIREAAEAERQACLAAIRAVDLDYRDRPGILVKNAVIEALEKRGGRA